MAPRESTAPYRLGDILALARASWVHQMARSLAALGYDDYRRSDTAVMRMLMSGPVPITRLGVVQGVTRQAARKAVASLEQRGYAVLERDESDSRQRNAVLTDAGRLYASAVVSVVHDLNYQATAGLTTNELVALDSALRAIIGEAAPWAGVARQVPPPSRPDGGARVAGMLLGQRGGAVR
ncbi:MAG: MarR family winged helix-turn-helix transcriptional regulator [Acidimicrobiales bacterium]